MNHYRFHNLEPNSGFGWLTRLGRLLGRADRDPQRDPILVTVWDARQGQYRSVDLLNTSDPLWTAARALAMLRSN